MPTEIQHNYKEIRMLPRDWELLSYLEEQGFATFDQLNHKFFFSKKPSCSMRLKRLSECGYIHKKRLLDFFQSNKRSGVKKGYFPHILNLNIKPNQFIYYINREYALGFGKSGQLFKPSMILHQLILNDMRDFLEKEVVHKLVLNDPKVKILSNIYLGRGSDTVPDLSIEYDHVRIAVEVERTPKGSIRYFKRFGNFMDSNYTHVIYYYTDEPQLKQLLKYAGTSKKFAFAHYRIPNELFSNVFGVIDTNTFIHRVLD